MRKGPEKVHLSLPASSHPGQQAVAHGDPTNNDKKTKGRHIRVTLLTLGVWNVCTLMDHNRGDSAEQRAILIAKEMARYKFR